MNSSLNDDLEIKQSLNYLVRDASNIAPQSDWDNVVNRSKTIEIEISSNTANQKRYRTYAAAASIAMVFLISIPLAISLSSNGTDKVIVAPVDTRKSTTTIETTVTTSPTSSSTDTTAPVTSGTNPAPSTTQGQTNSTTAPVELTITKVYVPTPLSYDNRDQKNFIAYPRVNISYNKSSGSLPVSATFTFYNTDTNEITTEVVTKTIVANQTLSKSIASIDGVPVGVCQRYTYSVKVTWNNSSVTSNTGTINPITDVDCS